MTRLRKPWCWRPAGAGFCAGLVLPVLLLAASGPLINRAAGTEAHSFLSAAQTDFPPAPADRTLIYLADERGALTPLPFEAGTMPIKTDEVAKSDKISYVELKGASAATLAKGEGPRLYVFVPDEPSAHPPFIVRLTQKRGARRVTAITQKGLRGYAIASEEIVKPRYRVLAREGGMVYMEISPREPLLPGEYGVVGADLQRIASFRMGPPSIP